MKAEIISIGTELLLGHIINTNASFLSQKLAEIGIDVYYQTTVGDNPQRLMESIKQAARRSDIIITSGGLGPTVDDVTVETIAKLLGKRVILNKTILKDLKDYFKLIKIKFPAETMRQAYLPEGVKWVRNNVGTAPGLLIEYEGKTIVCLPGPPREIEPMFTKDIVPYLSAIAKTGWVIKSRTIKTTGLGESKVDSRIKDLLKLKPPTTVGIYAKLREVDLKIMSKAKNEKSASKAIAKIERKIHSRLKDFIFGYDDETLEGIVAKLLTGKRLTIAVAESCTGGLLSHRLTNVSGSSKYFIMGIAAYSNEIKENILGIHKRLLDKHGAVSAPVALEMAKGAKFLACTDIGIGITGIAGPGGGTPKKPVGLVYIALVTDTKRIEKELRIKGSREEIKFQASQVALDLIRKNI